MSTAAAEVYRHRGWAPLPYDRGRKGPTYSGWQDFVADDSTCFDGRNIGWLLGAKSNGLVDCDLDCAEACALAPDVLPPTGAIFGRNTKPQSHRLYVCDPPPDTQQFQFDKAMLVELRSTGVQTMAPPSVHPSGELVEWAVEGEPAKVPADLLRRGMGDLAGLCLLVRHWPEPHGRYNAEGALIGALLRAGRPEEEVERLIAVIQRHAGAPRDHKPGKSVPRLAGMLAAGKRVPGLRRLKELLGGEIADKVAEWMGLRPAGSIYQIDSGAPYATARLFRELRYDADDVPTLHHHRGGFYAWDGAAYPEVEDGEIRAAIYRFLDDCVAPVKEKETGEWQQVPVKPNTNRVNNVLDALRAVTLLPAVIAAPAWLDEVADLDPGDIIACANGLLHLPTGALLPHTPAYFTHNALDFAFDAVAPAPAGWLAFLKQLWPDDAESIATLQEVFGYCLTADTAQQKAFLIVGPKRSGKGTIGRVLARLVGTDNAVAPTLAGIGSNFGLTPLIGKRVAIISDARLSGRADQAAIAERLLNITGEDAITIDRKYREAWTGRFIARFLVLTNELPRLADASGALASRFIVLVQTESFYGREDLGLTNRLLLELPGILNWAIEGWRRLCGRGYFIQPKSAQEAIGELEDLGSPIGAFVRDWCVVKPGSEGTVDAMFQAWENWCEEQRREQYRGDRQSFGRNLRAAVPGLVIKKRRIKAGGMERYYEGIRLKSVGERTEMTPEEALKEEDLFKQMERDSSKWPGDVPY